MRKAKKIITRFWRRISKYNPPSYLDRVLVESAEERLMLARERVEALARIQKMRKGYRG